MKAAPPDEPMQSKAAKWLTWWTIKPKAMQYSTFCCLHLRPTLRHGSGWVMIWAKTGELQTNVRLEPGSEPRSCIQTSTVGLRDMFEKNG